MPELRIPTATYRLQFNSQFKFNDARNLLSYLNRLGITDIYASPIFKAPRDSTHGYDVTDPNQLNPELGTEADFEALNGEMKNNNLGLLLDIVPNHMGISPENPFLTDLLKNGLNSPYANFFDIDWRPCNGSGTGKIILPILGKPYGQALEDGEISLKLEENSTFIRYYENKLPLALRSYSFILACRPETENPGSLTSRDELRQSDRVIEDIEKLPPVDQESSGGLQQIQAAEKKLEQLIGSSPGIRELLRHNIAIINGKKGNPRSFDSLDTILNQQVYRLTFWRTGLKQLNYRRFFDINNLISLRTELPEVLQTTHALIFQLVTQGKVTGLRIDHVDGLYDPAAYLAALRQHLGRFYVIVEKILSGDEILPGDWQTYGTTGYDFSREVNNVFVDSRGIPVLEKHYTRNLRQPTSFNDMVYEKKKQVMEELFSGESHSLSCRLMNLAGQDRYARDLAESDIMQALIEVTACLPVYRTYIRAFEIPPVDRRYIEAALQEARRRTPYLEETALDFLRRVFLLEFPAGFDSGQKQEWLQMVMKWQQFTGPATAKGLEDTALYNYNRLVSLNVIGAALRQDEWSVDKFHQFNLSRQAHWPVTLNATSTHDTKRSEDVRARINVLSEMPRTWLEHLSRWRKWNDIKKQRINGQTWPDDNTEELLYQTLVGAWPLHQSEIPEFRERFKTYLLKTVREAKAFTNWIRPDERYENAVIKFVDNILDDTVKNEFLEDFTRFQQGAAFYGALNSLGQALLKITSPGIPDFYQGTELWNLSLVDPDNRRPVDYELRKRLLDEVAAQEKRDRDSLLRNMLEHWQDGKIKLYLTYQALIMRQKSPELFQSGDYIPLQIKGKREENVVAFARRQKNEWIVVAVPRLSMKLSPQGSFPLGKKIWKEDRLVLPEDAPQRWVNIFTGETLNPAAGEHSLSMAQVFSVFPVALLCKIPLNSKFT